MGVIIIPETLLQSTIEGCLANDRISQRRFYMHFYGFGLAVCNRYLSGQQDVEGVLNDGFLKVFTDLKNFAPRQQGLEGALKAWIRRILVNTAIDFLRRQKRQVSLHDDMETLPAAATQANAGAEKMSYNHLLQLVARLSPAYRTAFNLFVIDGYSHEEISQMLGINIGTSKSNLSKAKVNLQRMIISEQKTEQHAKQAV